MNGLYQTLTVTPIPKKDITLKQKKILKNNLNKIGASQGKAIFMLILEHAKICDDFIYDPSDAKIPYTGEIENADILFKLEKFPKELRWVLWRFFDFLTEHE